MTTIIADKIVVPAGMSVTPLIFDNIQARGEQTGRIDENGKFQPYKNNGHVKANTKPGSLNCRDRWGITKSFLITYELRLNAPQIAQYEANLKTYTATLDKKKRQFRKSKKSEVIYRDNLNAEIAAINKKIHETKQKIAVLKTPKLKLDDISFEKSHKIFAFTYDYMDFEKLPIGTAIAMSSAAYAAPSACVGWLRKIVGIRFEKGMQTDVVDEKTIQAVNRYIEKYGEKQLIDKITKRYKQYFVNSANKVTKIKQKDGTFKYVKLQYNNLKGWMNRVKSVQQDALAMTERLKQKYLEQKRREQEQKYLPKNAQDSLIMPRDALRLPADTSNFRRDTLAQSTPPKDKATAPADTNAAAPARSFWSSLLGTSSHEGAW